MTKAETYLILAGWWKLLEKQTRPLPNCGPDRMLCMLRRGDGRGMDSMRDFYQLYDLATAIEDLTRVGLDEVREWMKRRDTIDMIPSADVSFDRDDRGVTA